MAGTRIIVDPTEMVPGEGLDHKSLMDRTCILSRLKNARLRHSIPIRWRHIDCAACFGEVRTSKAFSQARAVPPALRDLVRECDHGGRFTVDSKPILPKIDILQIVIKFFL
jgi:hypothetical protein